jgi:hypothetical protein
MAALASDYPAARQAFLHGAAAAGGAVRSVVHELRGPDGGELATDVAVFGDPGAPCRLLVISGTHGVEGFAGSLCQTRWLRDGIAPPPGLAVVMVHAINPYGFAWIRRVNEDNVDLNRNCVDFSGLLPANPGYDELADALVPPLWDDETQAATAATLLAYAAEHGFDGLQAAVSVGQYRHPTGIFYGGSGPVWSQRTLAAIVRHDLADAERVAILDLHTGLGPFGHGELIASHPDESGRARLDVWFGEYTVPAEGTSVSADVQGDVLDGMEAWLPGVAVGGVAIEWGTVDIIEVSTALRADAWLHAHADPRGPEAGPVKERLRAAFAPDDPAWGDRVLERFGAVRDRVVAGVLEG